MGVDVAVEEVAERELAGDHGDALDIAGSGDGVRAVGHFLGLAAQAEGLAQEVAVGAQLREGRAGLLRLAVDEARDAQRPRQAEALTEFRVVVELGVLEELQAEEERRRGRRLRLVRHEALRTAIGRAEAGHALVHEGGLAVQREARVLDRLVRVVRHQGQRFRVPDQPGHHLVRDEAGPGRHRAAIGPRHGAQAEATALAEIAVAVVDPEGEMGVDRELNARAQGEAEIGQVAGRGRRRTAREIGIGRQHPPVGPGKPEGRVDQVVAEGVAEPSAGGAEQVRLLADQGEGRVDRLVAEAERVGAGAALEVRADEIRLDAVDEGAVLPGPADEGAADHRGGVAAKIPAAGGVAGRDGGHSAGADRGGAEIVIAERGAGTALHPGIAPRPIEEAGARRCEIRGEGGSGLNAKKCGETCRGRTPMPAPSRPFDEHRASPLPPPFSGLADADAAAMRPHRAEARGFVTVARAPRR